MKKKIKKTFVVVFQDKETDKIISKRIKAYKFSEARDAVRTRYGYNIKNIKIMEV